MKKYKTSLAKRKASKEYYRKNPEKHKKCNDNWYAKNPGRSVFLSKRWKLENPEKDQQLEREYSKNGGKAHASRKCNYGITKEEYFLALKKQKDKCAICSKVLTKRSHTDHCHKTGKFRGILCHHCNLGIGFLKDDIKLLLKALKYLKEAR